MNQRTVVLDHLRAVGTISGLEAADLYRVRDLPKRISELKSEGHAIEGEWRTDHLEQRYKRYSLRTTANA